MFWDGHLSSLAANFGLQRALRDAASPWNAQTSEGSYPVRPYGRAERLRRVGSSAPPRRSPINYHIATNRSYLVMVVSGRGGEPSSSFSACFANVAVVVWLTLQFGISRTAQNPLDPDRRLISKPALRYACLSGHTGCQEL
jgi:hypothetical protein